MENRLNVWLHEQFAGVLQQNKGLLSFVYAESYLAEPSAMPLSCSLPLQRESFGHDAVRAFFSGLLPEGEKRIQIAKVLHVTERNDFQLLRAIGGECAGAVSLLPEGESPSLEIFAEPLWLTQEAIKELIQEMPRRPMLAGERGVRLSLAGAQDKLPVIVENGKVGIPLDNIPSTHILKPAIHDIDGTVYNEAFSLELAKRLGLPCVNAEIGEACGVPYLLIARYDRMAHDGCSHRLHQEDFCQALSIPPEMKYQAEGGPGYPLCIDLINKVVSDHDQAARQFVEVAVFNYFIGNNDAHGKNFSLIHHNKDLRSLSPFYDLLSTAVYPHLTDIMAMKIGNKNTFKSIELRHWERFSHECHFDFEYVKDKLTDFANRMPAVSKQVLDDFQKKNWNHPVCNKVLELIQARTQTVLTKFKVYSQVQSDVIESYSMQRKEYIQAKYQQIERIKEKIAIQIELINKKRQLISLPGGLLSRIFKQKKCEDEDERLNQLERRRNRVHLIETAMNGKLVEDLATKKLRKKEPHLAVLYDAEIQARTLNGVTTRLQQPRGRGKSLVHRRGT